MELVESKVLEPIEQMIERMSVNTVFGEPLKEGDTTIIPVAAVSVGFGYGYGYSEEGAADAAGAVEEGTEAEPPDASDGMGGSGGGGGGGGMAKPQGYLHVSPDGVTYEPIMDQGKIAIAGILMSGWSVFWIAKAIRALAGGK